MFSLAGGGRRAALPRETRVCPDVSPRRGGGAQRSGAGTGQLGPRRLPGAQWAVETGGEEGRCDRSVWFTSLARPSLSPSPAARGGAAVREGPAGPPGEVSVTKRWGGGHPGGDPSSGPPVRERRESCVSPGPRRACPAPAAVPVRCRAAPPLRDAAQPEGQHPSRCPAGRYACPQPRFLTVGWLEVGIASPAANKSSAPSAALASWPPRERNPRQPGASPGEASREAGSGMRRERGRGERGQEPHKAAGVAECVRVRFANRK